MNILHLTLKKKWYDMIASGEKKEEYREIKPYWISRLAQAHNGNIGGDFMDKHKVIAYTFKTFTFAFVKNGYQKEAPFMTWFDINIQIGKPNPAWCEPQDVDK